MSRLAAKPIKIIEDVEVKKDGDSLLVSHAGNTLKLDLPDLVDVNVSSDEVMINRTSDAKDAKAQAGLVVRQLENFMHDLKEGVKEDLEIVGTGYRASTSNNKLVLVVGYSHDVELLIPEGLDVKVQKNNITITGYDRQKVGQFAAKIRQVRPPEVYKGKGIKYKDEQIKKKAGKAAQALGEGA